MRKISVDSERCTGCMNCQVVCSLVRTGTQNPELAAIRVILAPFSGRNRHTYCRHCSRPACAEACPVKAYSESKITGALEINSDICVGCGSCVKACPFHAIAFSEAFAYPVKCNLCSGKPACVEACSFHCITYGSSD